MDVDKAVERIAERYRSEGFQVTVRPNDAQVPAFAAGLHLDLLATKSGEHRFRNAIVHGLDAPKIDANLPLYVAGAARKLLADAGQQHVSR